MRISQSARASPGGSTALRTRWTRRSELVNVPSFSANTAAGKTTSAKRVVSLRKGSCTTMNSQSFSPFSSSMQFGSEMTMSSPMTKKPRIFLPASFIITLRFMPGSGLSASTPQARSYFLRTSSSSTH